MALAVVHVGGASGGTDSQVSDSWTSVSGSLIAVVGHGFDGTNTPANGDVTDSKGNSYTFGLGTFGASVPGIGIWYNNDGTRGTSHTVTFNVPGTGNGCNISVCEITGQDITAAVYDTTTDAEGTDATSAYDVTAAAAIAGNQIAVYGVTLDTNDNQAWTPPTGYTNIFNEPNGAVLVSEAAYKLLETGTPTRGATSAHSPITGAREVFATFKEAVAGAGKQTVYFSRLRAGR